MDDIAFFDTSTLGIRGGIFSEAGKVSTEQALQETLAERASQSAVDLVSSAEDPASVTAETPALRKRHLAKAQSLDTSPAGFGAEDTPEGGLPRKDTAPAAIATAQQKAVTNKWLPQPSSLASQASTSDSASASHESLGQSSISTETQRVEDDSLAEAIATPLPMEGDIPSKHSSRAPSPPHHLSFHSLARPSTDATNNVTTERAIPHQENASPSSSTTTLLNSLRIRDKKAIQSQVNSAKDAVKKWGVNWAAKRRANVPGQLDERDESRSAALYRPPEDDIPAGHSRPPESPSQPSLKERLDAAAQSLNRERSASSASKSSLPGSRPNLLSSPSKSSAAQVSPSTSPPNFSLATSRLTSAPVSVPAPNPQGRSSGSAVYTQPSAGRTMVVPRVPKRPGEVTGLGSHPVQGITRRISAEDGERDDGKVSPHRGSEGTLSRMLSAVVGEQMAEEATEDLHSPVFAEDTDAGAATSSPSPPSGEQLVRAESAPPHIISPFLDPPPPPNGIGPTVEGVPPSNGERAEMKDNPPLLFEQTSLADDSSEPNVKSSSAEDALRSVAERDGMALRVQNAEEVS